MNEPKKIVIIGGDMLHSAKVIELKKNMEENMKELTWALGGLGMSMREANKAMELIGKGIPMDINNLDTKDKMFILDSLAAIDAPVPFKDGLFGEMLYDEAAPISRKELRRLAKPMMYDYKESARKPIYKQSQTDRWANSWDKKIKRKL